MNDLIDRKVLLENLKVSRLYHAETSREMSLLIRCENIVMGQPTAYDVDKVVQQMKSSSRTMSTSDCKHKYYKAIGTRKCEQIIRSGGKE